MGQTITYGVPTETLESVVEEYMIQQGNHRRNHHIEYMVTAREVWLELFRTTIWNMHYKVLAVNKTNNTVRVPCGASRIFGLSIIDKCGNTIPLSYDPNFNTLQFRCHEQTCSCETCNGEGTLCDAIDSITLRTETIYIDTIPYDKKIWNRKVGSNLVEVTETPAKDGNTVSYHIKERVICDLEVDTNGCVKATESNRVLIEDNCGCYIPGSACAVATRTDVTLPANSNSYGYWNPDAICDGVWHLKDVQAEKVIISYQVEGVEDVNNQIHVPVYAKTAVKFGMKYYGMVFKPNANRGEVRQAENDWERAKRKLFMFMHPITISELMKISRRPVKW